MGWWAAIVYWSEFKKPMFCGHGYSNPKLMPTNPLI
jgi:hypothetical protein